MFTYTHESSAVRKIASVFVLLSIIVVPTTSLLTPAVASATSNTNVCHTTGGPNGSWSQISVSSPGSLQGHLGHGDFIVDGDHPCPPPDSCGAEFTYVRSSDSEDYRVKIDIQDYSGDDDRRVVITPKSGYQLISIGIDYTGSDAFEATPSVGSGTSIITYTAPSDASIDNVTVVLIKTCPDLCPNIQGDQYTVPQGLVVISGQCVTPPPADTDSDTIPDTTDNCVATANTNQLDSDNDGIGDVCDNTPFPPCPEGQVGTYPNCTTPEPEVCPEGQVGTYPDCSTPEPEVCPEGTIGVYPACVPVITTCPDGFVGVYPICFPVIPETCPEGQVGIYPNCETPEPEVCPEGQIGTYPDCSVVDENPVCDEGQILVDNECVNTETPPTCAENQHLVENQCVNNDVTPPTGGGGGGGGNYFATCMNGVDDDSDGLTDMTDPGCANPFDGSEVNDAPTPSTETASSTGGEVLGAATSTACTARFTKFIMQNRAHQNDTEEVKNLQTFLNEFAGASLEIDGVYSPSTIKALKVFQEMYKKDALETWPTAATGNFYLSTQWIANKVNCEAQGLSWTTAFPSLKIFQAGN